MGIYVVILAFVIVAAVIGYSVWEYHRVMQEIEDDV